MSKINFKELKAKLQEKNLEPKSDGYRNQYLHISWKNLREILGKTNEVDKNVEK